MSIDELRDRLSQSLPIFLYEDEVKVVDVLEVIGLVEIEYLDGKRDVVDSLLLKDKYTKYEKGIPLGLFVSCNKGNSHNS